VAPLCIDWDVVEVVDRRRLTALVRTVYWVSPIFAVPEGKVRFWALTAFATSAA